MARQFDKIPALSVKGDSLVKALPDGFEELGFNLQEAMEAICGSGVGRMLLVDYDGLLRNRPQLDLIQDIIQFASDSDCDLELWVEAGIRKADASIDIFVAGASAVVIGTGLISSYGELKGAAEMSGELIASIDVCNGSVVSASKVIREKGVADLVRGCAGMGIRKFIVDSVVTDGSAPGDAAKVGLPQHAQILRSIRPALEEGKAEAYLHCGFPDLPGAMDQAGGSGAAGVIVDIGPGDLDRIGGLAPGDRKGRQASGK